MSLSNILVILLFKLSSNIEGYTKVTLPAQDIERWLFSAEDVDNAVSKLFVIGYF